MKLKIEYDSTGERGVPWGQHVRLKRRTEKEIESHGQVVSDSGYTAMLAIEWCRANRRSWSLTERVDGTYLVERLS